MTAVADSNATNIDQLGSIGDATDQQRDALRAAIKAHGAADLLPYFFDAPRTEGERQRILMQLKRETGQKRKSRARPKPDSTPKPAPLPLPKNHIGPSPEAVALRARMRDFGRQRHFPVHDHGTPNPVLARAYYDAHPEEAS